MPRDVSGLNPDRATNVPPPRKQAGSDQQHRSPHHDADAHGSGAPEAERDHATRPRGRRQGTPSRQRQPLVHSVPGDVVDHLKRTARHTERTYTDITMECLLACVDGLGRDDEDLDPFQRRIREADRKRRRPAARQLTLYLSDEERQLLEDYVEQLGMRRSHLVTEALRRGLDHVE